MLGLPCGLSSSCTASPVVCQCLIAVASPGVEHGLWAGGLQLWRTGSRAQVQKLRQMGLIALWRHVGLPGSKIEPVSPALASGFFATEPPGEPPFFYFCVSTIFFFFFFLSSMSPSCHGLPKWLGVLLKILLFLLYWISSNICSGLPFMSLDRIK